jgi:hypothetical protein
MVAASAAITRLLKFKASIACSTITQHIEKILPLHLKNYNNYFQGPVITLTFLFYNKITYLLCG